MADEKRDIQIPIVLTGADEAPIYYANQFICQFMQDEFVLTAAQFTPPILLGSEAEQREQGRRVTAVNSKVVVRLGMTRQRVVELIALLHDNLANFDRAHK